MFSRSISLIFISLLLFFVGVFGLSAADDVIFGDRFHESDGHEVTVNVGGQIQNYSHARPAIATIQSVNDLSVLRSQKVKPDGSFLFKGLDPSYEYSVEVTQPGFRVTPAVNSEIGVAFMTNQARKAGLSTKKRAVKETSIMSALTGASAEELLFQATSVPGLDDGVFQFHWSEDVSVSGAEYMSYINEPLDIEWLDKETSDITSYAAAALFERYEILLIDDKLAWSDEHAYRLLQMIERTGIPTANEYPQDQEYPYAGVWSLSEDALTNDMVIDWDKAPPSVTVSAEAFLYASPRIAKVEGKRGTFYSNRLFEVAVRFVTADGTDMDLASRIIRQRYGINIAKDAYFEGRYSHIPIPEVDRYPDIWQQFHADEVIELIAMLEEFPRGMRNISSPDKAGGLRNVLRRRNGLEHPWYPGAAAVAWPFSGHDYIEFMDKTFIGSDLTSIHRLIIHEKAHFIWAYILSNQIKYEWLKKSGWYRANGGGGQCEAWNEDPDSWEPPNVDSETLNALPEAHYLTPATNPIELEGGWASCSTAQFVSVYAAKLNPNEDMAESMAFFLRNPDMLRSRSLPKYEFIRDYVMQGSIYLSMIRPDLTFEVLNLYPDYIYPGKINRVDIQAKGTGTEDKLVDLDIGIHLSDGCDSDASALCFEGAGGGYLRILSPSEKAFIDAYVGTKSGEALDKELIGQVTIPSDAEPGWWYPKEIVTFDQVGNKRIEKLISNDYGWKLYVNNTDPDIVRPKYIAHSMTLSLSQHGDGQTTRHELIEGEQELKLTWRVQEDRTLVHCFVRTIIYLEDGQTHPKMFDKYGDITPLPDGQSDGATHQCEAHIKISRFMPKGFYAPAFLMLMDRSHERIDVPFVKNHPTYEEPKTMWVEPPIPDEFKPILDVTRCQTSDLEEQCLRVTAQPTQPNAPNGETLVRVYYWAWDDGELAKASGIKMGSIRLRNPQGQQFHYWHYEATPGMIGRTPQYYRSDFACPPYTLERNPECDATTKVQYVFETLLPEGSVPGTWGLSELEVIDHAGNPQIQQFTETFQFDVE